MQVARVLTTDLADYTEDPPTPFRGRKGAARKRKKKKMKKQYTTPEIITVTIADADVICSSDTQTYDLGDPTTMGEEFNFQSNTYRSQLWGE